MRIRRETFLLLIILLLCAQSTLEIKGKFYYIYTGLREET